MANEIQLAHNATGRTIYALIRNSTGSVWQTTTSTFVTYATANLANYDIALTEQGTASRYYAGDMPALAAGVYSVSAFDRSGGAPAEGDTLVGVEDIEWSGTAVVTTSALATAAALATVDDFLDTEIAAIKAKTDALFTVRSDTAQAGASTSITLDASASSVTDFYAGLWVATTGGTGVGQVRVITSYNGTTKVATINPAWATNPASDTTFTLLSGAYLAGIKGNVDGNVTGNVAGNVTGSTGSIASGGITSTSLAASATNAIADGILDRSAGIETSYTLRQSLRLILSACAAKISGAGTGTVTIRDIGDTKDRIVATTTAAGNRTAVTIDVS